MKIVFLLFLAVAAAASATPSRPHILFAIADDWSYPHAGAYGCKWVKTPAFDRVARDGILFANAYVPNAKCAPSRACILTGRNSWQLGAACNHISYFPPEYKSYAEALDERGYFVGMTAKGWGPGVALDADGKPRAMTGRAFNQRTAIPPTEGMNRNDYAANFVDFLDAAPAGTPWCFWYGSLEPHRAYTFGSGASKAGKRPADIDRIPGCWPDTDTVRNDLLDYALEIEHFDAHLGRMLDELERRGILESTLVMVTSDNGMPFPRAKGSLYEMSAHLPLAAMWPKGIRAPGRIVTDYVSFIDFAPTFLEVAGVPWGETGMAPTPGRSLTDIFAAPAAGRVTPARDHVLLGMERHITGRPNNWGYPIRGIVREGWLFLRNYEPSRWPTGNPEAGYLNVDASPTKTEILNARRRHPGDTNWALCFGKRLFEELYDLAADPDCLNNLAECPDRRGLKDRLAAAMEDGLRAQGDPWMFGNGGVFEAEPIARPELVNLYERLMRGEPVKTPWVDASDFESAPLDTANECIPERD